MKTFLIPRVGVLVFSIVLAWSFSSTLAQIRPLTFTAVSTGDNLVTPVETAGSATAVAVLVGNQLVVSGVYQDLGSRAQSANLRLASPGEDGPGLRLSADQGGIFGESTSRMNLTVYGDRAGTLSGAFVLTDEQVQDLKAGLFYVQIYSALNPSGELRGQLVSETVIDPSAEDLVGIWKMELLGVYIEYLPDATTRQANGIETLETNPDRVGTYIVEGDLVTITNRETSAREGVADCPPASVDIYFAELHGDGTLRMTDFDISCMGFPERFRWRTFTRVSP